MTDKHRKLINIFTYVKFFLVLFALGPWSKSLTYLRTFISTPARGLLQLYGTIEQLPKLVRSNLRRKEFIRLLVCLIFDLIGRHYVYIQTFDETTQE